MQEQQALPENSREKADESRPAAPPARRWIMRSMVVLLMISVLFNLGFYAWYQEYFTIGGGPTEQFETGDQFAADKIAIISITGTIMPPFTERILESIKTADEDDRVKGVLLEIDSPGGLVADSHQIYHRLVELRQKKPIVVSMKRMAASGGYYVAMGAGEEGVIFAEPTTWTGSLGVIIPRFDLSGLAENLGVVSDPLKTGEFKDALNPFREMSKRERDIWDHILDESYQRFLTIITDNRKNLDYDQVKKLATGQIYPATDARENGLIDEIGYQEDALARLQEIANLKNARVIRYRHPVTLADILLGSAEASQVENRKQALLDSTVPRAMYFASWLGEMPGWQ
ncbi:signal peptide peptidase SppA [Gimesia sp.]|uniref:signal peptide peptidase SppA n=1 Tax=Gimesia sp. TaxID=2024833 RepID=UPI000C665B51|nr:signal peptide peptidase SppA [Gimesia sp.]MAX35023.1 signal peptide peptidase SppA [Gimesia sp.]|tara:strand:+ start:2584 stop:3615 length:1032 start_codon:yes stop_codon:yes gene_type:complete